MFRSMAGKISRIEDLMVWQNARAVSKGIYTISHKPEFERDYRFVQQIRAAAGSVMDNIAEGFESGTDAKYINFLNIAKGSCSEVRSMLYVCLDRKYCTEEQFESLKSQAIHISSQLYKLIEYLNKK